MALCPFAVQKLIKPGPNDPRITPRVAILHVDAGNVYDLHDYFATRSGGIESHFHIAKDGTVFQYRDTAYQADANMDANDFAVSIETQGYASGEWTAKQLASIKRLLLWLHATHAIPLQTCPSWDGSGVGYHILFMQQWAGGPRACPGPDRIAQFKSVIVPWFATVTTKEEDMTLTVDDAREVWTANPIVYDVRTATPTDDRCAPSALLEFAAQKAREHDAALAALRSDVSAIKAKLDTLAVAGVDSAALAAKVADLLSERLKS